MRTDSSLDWLLDILGEHPVCRILAGVLIMALFFALHILFFPPEVGQWWQWLLIGVALSLIAGIILTWPRATFGTVLVALGGLLIVVPITADDGMPVKLTIYAIKIGVGAVIFIGGLALFRRAYKLKKRAKQIE